jgi:hypothetical protein
MPINEHGEYIRENEAPEKTPEDLLRAAYDSATTAQSRLPENFVGNQPEGVLYFSPMNVEQIQEVRDRFARLALENHITEFPWADGKRVIIVTEALEKMDRNLEFSRNIHKKLGL